MLIKLNFVDPMTPRMNIEGVHHYERPDGSETRVIFYDQGGGVIADVDDVAFVGTYDE